MHTFSKEPAADLFSVTNEAGVVTISTQNDLELDISNTPQYRDLVSGVIADAACSAVVLDLGQTSYIDATTLGVIVGSHREAGKQHKPLVVDAVDSPHAQRLFTITGLDQAFRIVDSRPE